VLFTKERQSIEFGRGTTTVAYRPIALDGTIVATELTIGLNTDQASISQPTRVEPLASIPPPCPDPTTDPDPATSECGGGEFDRLAEVEVFDVEAQAWRRLPHLSSGTPYAVADPARYVDPASGTALFRYVNERTDPVAFGVNVSISGDVR
jgi:hypothetical protein